MLEALRSRLAAIASAPARALPIAAARIEAKLRADATLHTGKVPSGITATATATEVDVTAPDWVMRVANDKGEPAEWAGILREELRRAAGGQR